MSDHPGGWMIGDHVEVGSLWAVRRARNRKGHRATGYIEGFNDSGVIVRFDCGPVNGINLCTASPDELTRIEDFDTDKEKTTNEPTLAAY